MNERAEKMSEHVRVSFLGGGNMAAALIGGIVEQAGSATGIQVMDVSSDACSGLRERFGVQASTALDEAFVACDVLVLAVKPQQMKAALAPLTGRLTNQLVLSIAAGLRIDDLARWLGSYRCIVRAMPNTPALIGMGVTGLYADASVSAVLCDIAARLMAAVGRVVWVEREADIDGVAAISGSGPAYVFYFIEALEAAARAQGFDAETARTLAVNTVSGAAQLAAVSDEPPSVLRERVTSKGGTTAAALEKLATARLPDTVAAAVEAAVQRARVMGNELGQD